MTNADRLKDLTDVQELIKALHLPAAFSAQLDPYVRPTFDRLWAAVRGARKRYLRAFSFSISAADVTSLEDLISRLRTVGAAAADELEELRDAGVTLASRTGAARNEIWLQTTDDDVARTYDMHEESEFLNTDAGLMESEPNETGDADV
jgi:hypothetical protein